MAIQKLDEITTPTVDHLIESISCIVQVDLSKHINPFTKVVGRVKSVSKAYGQYVYITLTGNDASISIKCPSSLAPNVGDDLVFEGRIGLKANKLGGFSVEMAGKPVEKVVPVKIEKPAIRIEKGSFISLEPLIKSGSFSGLAIFGTETAIKDIKSSITNKTHADLLSFFEIRTTSLNDVLSDVSKHLKSNHSGFLISRGGDDQTLDVWDDPELVNSLVNLNKPFYLALGHSHKMTLANQYADDSFPTPSIAGTRINDIFLSVNKDIESNQKIELMKQDIDDRVQKAVIKALVIPVAIIFALIYF